MPRTISYGMGQYRYNKNYNYINLYEIKSDKIKYITETSYQDIVVDLPVIGGSGSTQVPLVQYGRTFYMRLTVPQNSQYDTTLNLKLCPIASNGTIDTSRFQHIKRLVVPKTQDLNDDIYVPVILYEGPPLAENPTLGIHFWDENHEFPENSGHNANEIYLEKNNENQQEYRYYKTNGNYELMDDHMFITTIPKTWKLVDSTPSTVTYDFVFSPKYNLETGFQYLLIETDRTEAYHQSIQYIDDEKTYYGTRLNKDDIKIELYYVPNLLERGSSGQSQIQAGTNSLSHIAVWGHPNQILAINGEEIRIGQSGYYELEDFTINQLGVIVNDPNKDRFTIDYEYKIINN